MASEETGTCLILFEPLGNLLDMPITAQIIKLHNADRGVHAGHKERNIAGPAYSESRAKTV